MLENAPQDCFSLVDSAKFDPDKFAAFRNTEVMAKLLVLDGSTLNQIVGNNLAADGVIKDASLVHVYNDTDPFRKVVLHNGPANIMLDSLPRSRLTCVSGSCASFWDAGDPWLELIDGDHAWRQDGLPRFCQPDPPPVQPTLGHAAPESCSSHPGATPRFVGSAWWDPNGHGLDMPNAGTGRFPLWESCLARPAFRDLFKDWENGPSNFPDLGDALSPDPSVVTAPSVSLDSTGPSYSQTNSLGISYRFVDENNKFRLSATDDVFTPNQLTVFYNIHKSDSVVPPHEAFQISANGGTFSIPSSSPSGIYNIDFWAGSPCADSPVQTITFFFLNGPPRPPTLLDPEDKTNESLVGGVSWTMGSLTYDEHTNKPVYNPDPGIATFRVQVSESPTFSGYSVDATVQADYGGGFIPQPPSIPSYTFNPPLPDGTYYWRVSATDIAGHVGQFSTPRMFTVDTLAPTIFPPFVCDFVQGTRLCQSPLTIVAGGSYDNKLMVVSGGTDDTCCPTIIGSGIHRVTAQIIGPASSNSVLAETELTLSKVTNDWRGNFTFTGTLPEGLYTVKVVATDWAGNHSEAVIEGPVLYDHTPPVLTIPQTITAEASNPVGTQVPFTATAVDNVDGLVIPSCAPTSGSTFLLDISTTVTCRAYDRATNFMDASFVVTVVDTAPPSLTVPSAITVEATGPLTTVTYAVSASDLVDGNVPVQCSSPSGSLFPLGGTMVTCTAKDRHGNVGTSSFSVTVRDTTPPKTTITSAMDGNSYPVTNGGTTLSPSITFSVRGTDAVALAYFECSLDTLTFARCSSTPNYTGLSVNLHTFKVRAIDSSGNVDPIPDSFAWTIITPGQAAKNLIDTVKSMNLQPGVNASLTNMARRVSTLLNDNNPSNDLSACTDLDNFIRQVNLYESQGKLTQTQASQLRTQASLLKTKLGCP